MKKNLIFKVAVICAVIAMFAGCSTASDGGTVTYIGSKKPADPKAIGDIVFSDGSATPYSEIDARTSDPKITDEEKAAAIAVIYYVGTGLNSDAEDGTPDTTTSRTLGVGLKQDYSVTGYAWCTTGAQAYSVKITSIICKGTIDGETYTFTGDKNGSDNLKQIASFLNSADDLTDDTETEEKYPAFYHAKKYASAAGITVEAYKNGWYLPSIAELYALYQSKATMTAAIELCEGVNLKSGVYYRSSTQRSNFSDHAERMFSSDGSIVNGTKDATSYVCAIREF